MKKTVYFITIFLSLNAQAQNYLAHKTPVESILVSSSQQTDANLLAKAQKECFDHLSLEIIKNRTSTAGTEADIALKNIFPKNILQTQISIDPKRNGFSTKYYKLNGIEDVTDEKQDICLTAYTKFEVKHFQDTLSHTNYDQLLCWVDRVKVPKNVNLGKQKTKLVLIDGDGTSKFDESFLRYDFNDTIEAYIFKAETQPNFGIYNQERRLNGPANNGAETQYHVLIPESIWIDDDFENRFVPTDDMNYVRVDMRSGNYKNYINVLRYPFPDYGFEKANEKYSFYF